MPQYVVYRHGFNEANQSPARGQPEKMAVARLEAATPEEACRLAAQTVSLHPGQHFSAELAAQEDAQERAIDRTARAGDVV